MSQKNRTKHQSLTDNRIQRIASNKKMKYAGICISVRGKGYSPVLFLTTGDIIPVNILTTPSIPRCILEKVIELVKNLYMNIIHIFYEMQVTKKLLLIGVFLFSTNRILYVHFFSF
jgi:hypothetical protein